MCFFLRYQIEMVADSSGYYYRTSNSWFQKQTFDKYIRFFQSFVRDFLMLFMIFLMNILIMVSVRRNLNKKGEIFDKMRKLSKVKQILSRAEKAKTKSKIMVMVIGFIYIVGHFPLAVFYLPFVENSTYFWKCYYVVSWIPFYVSYTLYFFVYLKFNCLFRSYFNDLFVKIIRLNRK